MTTTASPASTLLALRGQIDARWPRRSKASDGLMGDLEHQKRASDHNQGDALDITHDPANGPDLEALAELLIADERVHYVIWNRRIRNRAFDAGAWRPYTGASPHTQHLHVSIHPDKRDATGPWKLPGDAAPEPEVRAGGGHGAVLVAGLGLLVAVALLVHHSDRAPPPRYPYRPRRY